MLVCDVIRAEPKLKLHEEGEEDPSLGKRASGYEAPDHGKAKGVTLTTYPSMHLQSYNSVEDLLIANQWHL